MVTYLLLDISLRHGDSGLCWLEGVAVGGASEEESVLPALLSITICEDSNHQYCA